MGSGSEEGGSHTCVIGSAESNHSTSKGTAMVTEQQQSWRQQQQGVMIAQQQLQPWSEQQRGHGNREAQEFHRSFSVRVQTKMDLERKEE
jgi:hypothetical protein